MNVLLLTICGLVAQVRGQSLLEKTIVSGESSRVITSGTATSTIIPGLVVNSVCSSLGLVAARPAYNQPASQPTNVNFFLLYSQLGIPPQTNWVSGGCTAFVSNAPIFYTCTRSLSVLCSRPEPTTLPSTVLSIVAQTVTAGTTVTVTQSAATATVTDTVTTYMTTVVPTTLVSITQTTVRITFTSSNILSRTSTTLTTANTNTITQSHIIQSFTTEALTVSIQVTIPGSTLSIVSLTEDIVSIVFESTETVTSCPFSTTTGSTATATVTLPSFSSTSTSTARTLTATTAKLKTTGTCPAPSTFTTLTATKTETDVAVETVTVIVPPPPCPPISPCDRIEGCYACPYEFPCRLMGPLERCGISDPNTGLVLAVSRTGREEAGCVCSNLGPGLQPAVVNATNQQTALNMMSGCLGGWQYAWIGSWNGIAGSGTDDCPALFVEDEYGVGGATIPADCQLLLPVFCSPS